MHIKGLHRIRRVSLFLSTDSTDWCTSVPTTIPTGSYSVLLLDAATGTGAAYLFTIDVGYDDYDKRLMANVKLRFLLVG